MKYKVTFFECHGDDTAEFEVEASSSDEAVMKAVGIFYKQLEPSSVLDYTAEVEPLYVN